MHKYQNTNKAAHEIFFLKCATFVNKYLQNKATRRKNRVAFGLIWTKNRCVYL